MVNPFYLVISGSHAYGTNLPDSDLDRRGICYLNKEQLLGLSNFEQSEDKVTDTVIYGLPKFIRLALDANPNILEILAAPEDCILEVDDTAWRLRDSLDLFLSKKVVYTYSGYAFAQLKRIRTHRNWLLNPPAKQPTRSDFNLPEYESLISGEEIGYILWMFAEILKDSVFESRLSSSTKDELKEIVDFPALLKDRYLPDEAYRFIQTSMGLKEEVVEAIRRERSYRQAKAHWDSYINWKQNRNTKRAEIEAKVGFDGKHAGHLVRLLRTGEEILSGKGLIVRRPDAEELLSIRNGAWTFEQVEEYASNMEEKLSQLKSSSTLPNKPNFNAVQKMLIEIQEQHL